MVPALGPSSDSPAHLLMAVSIYKYKEVLLIIASDDREDPFPITPQCYPLDYLTLTAGSFRQNK